MYRQIHQGKECGKTTIPTTVFYHIPIDFSMGGEKIEQFKSYQYAGCCGVRSTMATVSVYPVWKNNNYSGRPR